MNKQEFEVGDLVYYPRETNKICRLDYNDYCHDGFYPLSVEAFDGSDTYLNVDEDGKDDYECLTAAIFHATEENHAKLEKLYGIEFEKPKPKPTPKEIIEHLLTKQKYVLCQVSDYGVHDARTSKIIDVITQVSDRGYNSIRCYAYYWRYAIPIDNNGNEITEIE